MSDKSDDGELLGLFSTRSRSSGVKQIASESASNEQSSAVSKDAQPKQTSKPTATPSAGISSVARAVMKEARMELGSHDSQMSANVRESDIAKAVDKVCQKRGFAISDITRADVIVHLKKDLLGWGVLQPLIDNPEVTDMHCYDYQTVVLQKGKASETTGLHWPTHEAYCTFIDRLLFRLGKSLSTQQHTIDASFPDGKRVCAVHQSVCGSRGPILTIRVPRIQEVSLEGLIAYQVAPPLIVNYLAALVRTCEFTFMVSGETGTGKTTLMRCLGTQFRPDESVIGVEDTPELNYQHPYYRSLVSRPANTEGVGEVTLQEHIKTTLRLCPSRVILGEMRTPEAAEAFLESAQTGHCGMATVHARNARETLTRLEALLGRAQRGVSIDIIRQQIALAISTVIWMTREKSSGRVRLAEIIEVGNFVEGNIQVRPMFKLAQEGENPKWEVLSWSSNYEDVLHRNGIVLGNAPQFLSFTPQTSTRGRSS